MAYASVLEPGPVDARLTRTGSDQVPFCVQQMPVPSSARATVAQPAPIVFDVVTTIAGFEALAADWNGLFERAGSGLQVFQTFEWCAAWVRHYHDAAHNGWQALAIGTIRSDGALIGILPFVVQRTKGIKTLSFLGDPVSQYGDVLMADRLDADQILRQAWQHLVTATKADVADFRKVRADARIAPLVAHLGMTRTGGELAPYCDLAKAGSYDALAERISPKLRKNWRRQHRRLEERGALAYEVPTGDRAGHDAHLALVMKQAWLVEKGRLSRAFKDERIHRFFEDTARSGRAVSGVDIDVLRTAGEMAAASISVTAKKRRALHIVVYSMKFEKAGAGSVNLAHTLKRAFDDGVEIFDFLAPAHDYKLDWADGHVAVDDFVWPLTSKGRLYARLWLNGVRKFAKHAIGRLPKASGRILGWLQKRPALIGLIS